MMTKRTGTSWMSRVGEAASGPVGVSAIVVTLLLLLWAAPHIPNQGWAGQVRFVIEQARGRTPMALLAELRQGNVGYYDSLMTVDAADYEPDQSLLSRLWTFTQPTPIYRSDPYTVFKGAPNLNLMHPVEGPLVTNSQGLFDRQEHTLGAVPGVRRVALLGNSLTRGLGVEENETYASVVEACFNAEVAPETNKPYEFINFSVSGYRPTQSFGMAMEEAPKYHPDVYVFSITPLGVASTWSSHIAQLVAQGADLRYDFLKRVVLVSGVKATDSASEAARKLAPYKMFVLRQILMRLKTKVASEGAVLIVSLVNASSDLDLMVEDFRPVLPLLKELGIPAVDLLHSFDGVDDIESMRNFWYDVHPNAEGHLRMAATFLSKVSATPTVWNALTGGAPAELANKLRSCPLQEMQERK